MIRLVILTLFVALLPQLSLASSVVRAGDSASVAVDYVVEGDFYGFGNSVIVSGEILDDVLVLARTLKINGQIGKDVLVSALNVNVDGVVGDDLRIVAGEVVVAGEVKGDLVVVANDLKVLSTAKVAGDIIFYGTKAEIEGQIGKSIYGTSEVLRINGVIGGDVDVETSFLTLGDRADVTGVVEYNSINDMVRSPDSRIVGNVVKNDPKIEETVTAEDIIIPLLIILFSSLACYLLFPRLLGRVVDQGVAHSARSILIGFSFLLLIPVIASILIVSMLGSLFGVALLLFYFGLLITAFSISSAMAGVYLFSLFKKGNEVTLPKILLGGVSIYVITFVPIIGLFFIVLFLLTLGALTTQLFRNIRLG